MSNFTPPLPDLPPEIEDYYFSQGLDPADYVYSLGDRAVDPDIRSGFFDNIEDALNYVTEVDGLLGITRFYYDDTTDRWYIAIPSSTE